MTFQKSLNLCVEFSSRKIEFRAFFLKRISGVEFYCRDEVMQNAPKISMFTFELFSNFLQNQSQILGLSKFSDIYKLISGPRSII